MVSVSFCLDNVFYLMCCWLMLLYISGPISSLNDEKAFWKTPRTWTNMICGSTRKVKQQFAHRAMWFELAKLAQNILFGPFNCDLIAKYKAES